MSNGKNVNGNAGGPFGTRSKFDTFTKRPFCFWSRCGFVW